jgi:hypothetical protein
MKKRLLSLLMTLTVLFVVACSQKNNSNENIINSDHMDDKSTKTESNAKNQPVPTDAATQTDQLDINLEGIQGSIKKIYYADSNKLLISGDKLYLFDLESERVLAEAQQEEFDEENYWVIKDGYVTVRVKFGSGSTDTYNYSCIFYDQNFNKVSEFDFNTLINVDDYIFSISRRISFSADGKRVAFATNSGLYVYDFGQNQKTTLIDLTSEDLKVRSGIVNVEQIGFTNDDNSIAFKAQSFDIPAIEDKPSFDTCGIINADGSGLSNKRFGKYFTRELTAYNDFLLYGEDFSCATGRILVMNTPSGKTKIYNLIEKDESINLCGSDDGYYFATSIPKNSSSWIIRVYNMETGKLEAEQSVSSHGKDLYMAQDPIIKVIDETRTLIVLLGSKQSEIESEMIIYKF